MKCVVCGNGQFTVDFDADSAVCTSCGSQFKLSQLIGKTQSAPAKNNDFEIVAGTLVKYRGSDIDVVVPDGVLEIGGSAFAYMHQLRSVKLPEGLIKIGYGAFQYCSSLSHINLPTTIKSISDYAFRDCESLVELRLPGSIDDLGSYSSILEDYSPICSHMLSCTVYVPSQLFHIHDAYICNDGSTTIVREKTAEQIRQEAEEAEAEAQWKISRGICPQCGGSLNWLDKCKKCGTKF